MPKKFVGENSKAVTAKARKSAAADLAAVKKQQELEDASWKDDDKSLAKKQQKKEESAKKKQALLDKKAESKLLLEQELSSITQTSVKHPPPVKVTRAHIQAEAEKRQAQPQANVKPPPETHIEKPIEENINRVQVEGIEARTIEDAISALSTSDSPGIDRHPERRLKAAFTAFEEANMPRIKAENPTLRLSQLKQLLRKEWTKSPENPLNQTNPSQ